MKPHAQTWCLQSLSVLCLAAAPLCLAGCGGEPPAAAFDATALLAHYEQQRQRHDPRAYSEVDLGEFTVAWRERAPAPDPATPADAPATAPDPAAADDQAAVRPQPTCLIIRFHLYGVVADDRLEEFSRLLETHGERVRSNIREAVQGSDLTQLNDPALGWLKSELIQSINQSLQTPILRNAVFGEFALDRG